jgi:hypothetical protein
MEINERNTKDSVVVQNNDLTYIVIDFLAEEKVIEKIAEDLTTIYFSRSEEESFDALIHEISFRHIDANIEAFLEVSSIVSKFEIIAAIFIFKSDWWIKEVFDGIIKFLNASKVENAFFSYTTFDLKLLWSPIKYQISTKFNFDFSTFWICKNFRLTENHTLLSPKITFNRWLVEIEGEVDNLPNDSIIKLFRIFNKYSSKIGLTKGKLDDDILMCPPCKQFYFKNHCEELKFIKYFSFIEAMMNFWKS